MKVVNMSPSLDLIREYLSWMKMDGQYEESTITERGRFLAAMDGKLPFGLERALPEELAEEIHRPASASGRAGYFDHFCGFYRWAADPDDQWLDSNPMVKMRRPRIHNTGINPERLPADEHVAEILVKARDPWLKYAALAMFSGARCIEISRLDREHVTEEWTLLQGKRRKPRRIPTHDRVWAIARELPPGPIARLGDGSRATRQYISIKTAAYLRNTLGVPVSLHMLRHWCATKALEGGADLRVVQELLGHASPGVTARYTHVNDSQLRRAVASLPSL